MLGIEISLKLNTLFHHFYSIYLPSVFCVLFKVNYSFLSKSYFGICTYHGNHEQNFDGLSLSYSGNRMVKSLYLPMINHYYNSMILCIIYSFIVPHSYIFIYVTSQGERVFYKKWAHIEKHNLMILAFKTEWKYYFWIRNYECICVFNNFPNNEHT